MKVETNLADIKRYYNLLFFRYEISGHFVLFTKHNKMSYWIPVEDHDDLVIKTEVLASTGDVHCNVALQSYSQAEGIHAAKNSGKQFNGRGTEKSAIWITSIYGDIDIAAPEHSQTNLPSDLTEALSILDSLPVEPSLIIESGNGIHFYILFDKAFDISQPEGMKAFKALSTSLQNCVIDTGLKKGFKLDNVGDPTRMLRPGGTNNFKDPEHPKVVRIIKAGEDIVYSFEFLQGNFAKDVKTKEDLHSEQFEDNGPENQVGYLSNNISENCAFIKHCVEDADKLTEPEWFAGICVFAYCEDGRGFIHKMSSGYPNYSYDETEGKIEHAINNYLPRTCQNIADITGKLYCLDCIFNGRINSPISLAKSQSIPSSLIIDKAIKGLSEGDFGAYLTEEFLMVCSSLQENDLPKFAVVKQQLKKMGASMRDFTNGIKRLREKRVGLVKHSTFNAETCITPEIVRESPNPIIAIPPQYEVLPTGTFKIHISENGDKYSEIIAHYPIIITRSLYDIDSKIEMIGLAFKKNEWREICVELDIPSNSRKIVELSNYGMPVNSNNASAIVQYIADLAAFNQTNLKTIPVSGKLGWNGTAQKMVFLLPDRMITREGQKTDEIQFRSSSDGEASFASSISECGSLQEWFEIIKRCQKYPRVLTLMYSSFSAVLLPILGVQNFVVEIFGRSSRGKTTALRVAASVWGNPDESAENSFMQTWDSTKVHKERIASMVNGIPMIVDDTKRSKSKDMVAETIYMINSGRGKARANLKGTNETKTFRTVLLSTGETPATSFTKDGGTRGRTLEISGRPFNNESQQTAIFVKQLEQGLKANYGFAGPMFAAYVANHESEWDSWRKEKESIEIELMSKNSSPIAGRLASFMAAIIFTVSIVNEAISSIFIFPGLLDSIWDNIIDNAADSNSEKAALQHVVSWAESNQQSFEGREVSGRVPTIGWAGKWPAGQDWDQICFLPSCLNRVLGEAGYNVEEILSHWKDSGVIDVDTKSARQYTKQLKFFGSNAWMTCIKRSAVDIMNENSDFGSALNEDIFIF